LLEHDELLEKVWDDTFVEQSSLKKGISALRRILEESPQENSYIKTVPRRGYSFITPVKPISNNEDLVVVRYSVTEVEEIEEEIFIDDGEELVETNNKSLPVQRRSKFPWLIASAALILIAGFIGWKYFASKSTIDFTRMQIVPLTNSGNEMNAEFSRNGEFLVLHTIEKSLSTVSVKHLPTGKLTQILKPQKVSVYGITFEPDNGAVFLWLHFTDEPQKSGVYKIGIEGGEPQKISNEQIGIKFSPDGKRIAYRLNSINEKGESGMFIANSDLGEKKLVFSFNPAEKFILHYDWSPDNRSIISVFRTTYDNQKLYSIAQISADGGTEQFIVPPRPEPIYSASWFPDGKGIAVTALDTNTQIHQIWYFAYPSGEWRRITNDLTPYRVNAVAADGKSLIATQQRNVFKLWVGESDGLNFRQITFDTINYESECGWLDDETVLFAAKT
ncbi:MAG TPA: winged helix-turn-helix domain-containing protein, partial [Pyrinomonadaceae bacterium]|nr:winged helix-turn-helix domain-containing protein [Pyrinomonadaceae bacterium]